MSKEEIAYKLPDIEQFAELGDYLALPGGGHIPAG